MANILLATLGESPAVVTEMYQLLTQKASKPIDKVFVLCPKDALVQDGYTLLDEILTYICEVDVEQIRLDFEDVHNEHDSYTFLNVLYSLLSSLQQEGHTVYLSLAGGRKNMSALMAVLVPLFPCVEGLYHVIDRDLQATTQRTIEHLKRASDAARRAYFFPPLERLKLVTIPYGEYQQVSSRFRAMLYSVLDEEALEDLYKLDPDEANALEFVQDVAQENGADRLLEVLVTGRAAQQLRQFWQRDRTHARGLKYCLERMRFASILYNRSHDVYTYHLGKNEHDPYSQPLSSLTFHFFKRGGATERPVFHTVPKDIKGCENITEVERVIVSEMEFKRNGQYRSLKEITSTPHYFPLRDFVSLPKLLKELTDEAVLIVPLGATPMVATQLCALLQAQGRTIKKVMLVYPLHQTIQDGASMLQEAFKDEGIECTTVAIKEHKDIDSYEACLAFEQALARAIKEARTKHPGCQIELALSGGRKGMAALTMFAAQRNDIHYVYHTLINDEQLSEQVERETSLSALNKPRQIRNDRLFLRAYEGNGPYTKFTLFKVPVLPARG